MRYRTLSAVAVGVALVHVFAFLGVGPVDDDFIVYRHARHLIEGHGPVFNLGERVEGFTVPLWLLVIAVGIGLGFEPWNVSVCIGVLACAVCVGALSVYWRLRFADARWPVPALLLALSGPFAFHAVVGLGTTLLACLLTLWLVCALRGERNKAARGGAIGALGAACLLRPEAVLFAGPWVLSEWRLQRSRLPLLALAPVAGWTLFRLGYYGKWLPNTYGAKALPLPTDLRFGLEYLVRSTLECGIGLWVAFVVVVGSRRRRGLSGAEGAAALGLGLHTAYVVAVGGDYLEYARFFVPTLPLAIALSCSLARDLVRAADRSVSLGRERTRRLAVGLAGGLAVVLLAWPRIDRGELLEGKQWTEQRWKAVGLALGEHLPSDASVAVSAVGSIGYFSGLGVVDMLGLTNDALRDAEPDLRIPIKAHQRYDAEWVLAQEPDVILIGNGVMEPSTWTLLLLAWEQSLFMHPHFRRDYCPLSLPVDGSYPLVLYLHRDSTAPSAARAVRWRGGPDAGQRMAALDDQR